MIKCPNCNIDSSEEQWDNCLGYCPICGYAHKISGFERESIKRRVLADFACMDNNKVIYDAGAKEVAKDWMLKREYISASLENNNLFRFIANHLGNEAALRVAAKYRLETHNYKEYYGAAIFYQYDEDANCHAFKVMQYNQETGKRIKISSENESGNEEPKEERALLYQKPLMGIGNYCLFGRHLLRNNSDRAICIVESEKTALLASIVYPDAIWMATGSCYYLTKEKINFSTANLFLFPDPDVKDDRNGNWYIMAEDRFWLKGSKVSHFMENYCKKNNKTTDFDIADYIIENIDTSKPNNNLASIDDILQ